MDNRQKKTLLSKVYKTIMFLTFLCIAFVSFVCIVKLSDGKMFEEVTTQPQILWINIPVVCLMFFLLCVLLADCSSTRKMSNKSAIGKFLYLLVFLTISSLLGLVGYVWLSKQLMLSYSFYIYEISFVLMIEFSLCVNFVIGLNVSKLHKSTTVTIDSSSETPNFDDEVVLKKKLDELNRKLAMKKVQEEIESVEKKLNE